MKKGIYILAFTLFIVSAGFSQSKYQRAIGGRIGGGYTDLRPTIRISAPQYYDYSNFYFGNFGVSARYTFR